MRITKIEIVDYYLDQIRGHTYMGNLHVYLPELQMDVRGMEALTRQNTGLTVKFPLRRTIDDKTRRSVTYPLINFADPADNDAFLALLYKKALPFIAEKMKNLPQPLEYYIKRGREAKDRITAKKKAEGSGYMGASARLNERKPIGNTSIFNR